VPALLGFTAGRFASEIERLDALLEAGVDTPRTGNVPLTIGIRRGAVDLDKMMALMEAKGARGVVDMTPLAPEAFEIRHDVVLPPGDLYLLLDVDTGRDRLNISPEASLAMIRSSKRTPLTMEEGVSLAVQHPSLLTDKSLYNSIQMPGSRRANDQRVPALWISRGRPRLGWCWDRNFHTWLGSASAAVRLGVAPGHTSAERPVV
jgi:hypothetical protein